MVAIAEYHLAVARQVGNHRHLIRGND